MKQSFCWKSYCPGAALASNGSRDTDCLESLDVPAVLIAPDHNILCSSSGFEALLGKSRAEIDGRRIGEVLECKYAANLGSCGETGACFMCGFQRFIELSLLTGERLPDFEIGINHLSGDRRTFIIRTEKFNDVVLLAVQKTSAR